MLLLSFSGLSIHHCLQLFAGIIIWWLFVVVLELQIPLPRRVQEWLKRMLRGLSFICPRFHDTCARHEQLKLGCSMTHVTSFISTSIWHEWYPLLSWLTNCGPPSDMITFGKPNQANFFFNKAITLELVIDVSKSISMKLVK